jgi:hypothetical protein
MTLSLEPPGAPILGTAGTDGDEGTRGSEGTDGADGSDGAGRVGSAGGLGRFGTTVGTDGSDGVGTVGRPWPTAGAATTIASPTPKTRPDLNPSSVPEVSGPSRSDPLLPILPPLP